MKTKVQEALDLVNSASGSIPQDTGWQQLQVARKLLESVIEDIEAAAPAKTEKAKK